jgi:hypothetical protein
LNTILNLTLWYNWGLPENRKNIFADWPVVGIIFGIFIFLDDFYCFSSLAGTPLPSLF